MTGAEVSLGQTFDGVLGYGLAKDPERVEWVEYHNLGAHDRIGAGLEMQMVASHSKCKNPVYHTSINWHPDDDPAEEEIQAVAEQYLQHMGLAQNQVVFVAHNDTAHKHVHIMANRVYPAGHPKEHTAWELDSYIGQGRDRKYDQTHNERVQRFLRPIEKQKGWTINIGKYHGKELDSRNPKDYEYHQAKTNRKIAAGMGVDPDSVDGRSIIEKCEAVKDELWAVHDKGKKGSFKAFDQVLDKQGLWLDMARNKKGMVIFDGQFYVKASDVQGQFSGPNLKKVFGESLKSYVYDREESLKKEQGITTIVDWLKDQHEKELREMQGVLQSQIPGMQRKLRELKDLNSEYNKKLSSLEAEVVEQVSRGYNNKGKALSKLQAFINDHVGNNPMINIQEALHENPGRFGEVRDKKEVQWLAEVFQDVERLEGEYSGYFSGGNRKERLKELQKMEQQLDQKQSRLKSLRARLGAKAKQLVSKGSDAGRELINIYNKSMMIYRATKLLYRFFNATKPTGRNKTLDREMAKALTDINESIERSYQHPAKVKELFTEVAWNDYRNPEEGVDIISDLENRPSNFGTLKDHIEAEILAERLRRPEQIRAEYQSFLAGMGDTGQKDEKTGRRIWDGRWISWTEGEPPSLNFPPYNQSGQTIDEFIAIRDGFVNDIQQRTIPKPVKDIVTKRANGMALEDLFSQHEDFIRSQQIPKDTTQYFKQLPDVYRRQPNLVGGLSIAQELNRWIGQLSKSTEAGRALYQTGKMGISLARGLASMIARPTTGAQKGVRAMIKEGVTITAFDERSYGKEQSQSNDKGLDFGR